jgi:hypothetical protein
MTSQNTQSKPPVEVQRLVRPSRFAFRDRYGWPVERIIGRSITNVIRLILYTDIVQSCRRPNSALCVKREEIEDELGCATRSP